jgi:hypothetical protein
MNSRVAIVDVEQHEPGGVRIVECVGLPRTTCHMVFVVSCQEDFDQGVDLTDAGRRLVLSSTYSLSCGI